MSAAKGASLLERIWYPRQALHPASIALIPLSGLYCLLAGLRGLSYRLGLKRRRALTVPVIIVGNISVGGTGKTPLTIYLAHQLKNAGYRPGIISRGYRGQARSWPQQVRPDSDPIAVGDEAVLMARATGMPVAVGPDRVAAGQALLKHHDCDLILSDDGLQHLRLKRDIEILVIDAQRGHGNGLCLPAGPLRERKRRAKRVDLIIENGLDREAPKPLDKPAQRGHFGLKIEAGITVQAHSGQQRPLQAWKGQCAHAVAGTGHPERIFQQLRQAGIQLIEHPYPDHHPFQAGDLDYPDKHPILMTEKDAVKYPAHQDPRCWIIGTRISLDKAFMPRLLRLLDNIAGKP